MSGLLLETLLYGGLVPAAVSAAALFLALWFSGRNADGAARGGGAVALGGGFFAGYAAPGWAPLVPAASWHWLPYLGLIAGAAGLADLMSGVPQGVRWGLRGLTAALSAWLLVPAEFDVPGGRPWWLAGVAIAVVVLWSLLDPVGTRRPGVGFPLQLLAVALAGSCVLLLAGSAKFAQLAGVLAATLGGCALVSYWHPQRSLTRGMIPGFAVLLSGLLCDGYLYTSGDVPLASFLLVLAAPLMLATGTGRSPRAKDGRWRPLLQFGAVLVPLGLAILLAAAAEMN